MIGDTKWASFTTRALRLRLMLATVHRIVVAGLAEVVAAFHANEEPDRAAVQALEVNELIAMLLAHVLTKAELAPSAWSAKQVFSAGLVV